ncbi:MAG TPA: NAD-dependent succinate-semialdehyde dehydrogenase [Flavobacteriaceae bacterium]|nr:NAD-dependent succinate-semialdehyde dehydrogenase [Flavobacteriaceae bacterium]
MITTTSTNPYNGEKIDVFENHTQEEVDDLINRAHERFLSWRETSFEERKTFLLAVSSELNKNKNKYARVMVNEMGKPISQAIAEIEKCAWVCEYYAENAEKQLKRELIETDADKSYVCFEPLGVILAVMPWNFPFWQVFRFAAPALMAGNVPILKHASNVFGCARELESVFINAGMPKNCFTSLYVGSDMVKHIVEHPLIKAATLTGSGPAGGAVASIAGKNIKKMVLELGGSNALIVLKDCDIAETVRICVNARFQNTGQSCIAGKRLLLQEDIADKFLKKLVKKVGALRSGDPHDETTFIGVMAREDLAADLEKQMRESVKMGAKIAIGGKRDGTYFEPTVLTEVTPEMPVFYEETFGPLLSVTTFKDIEEAIELSNKTIYGLGVSIFTADVDQAEKMVPKMEEGSVFINELVKSDPRLPFGGVKESGFGRELSAYGIREFVNKKTIFIKKFHFS